MVAVNVQLAMPATTGTLPQTVTLLSVNVIVPVVTAAQMLTWLDGREASAFRSIGWNTNRLTFTVQAGAGARGLQEMLPTQGPSGTLTALTRAGGPVVYTTQTIKGIQYALFGAADGGELVNVCAGEEGGAVAGDRQALQAVRRIHGVECRVEVGQDAAVEHVDAPPRHVQPENGHAR